MSEPFNVLLVGVGGQGVVLASDILTTAAMLAGRDAKKSEIHGMSQRGGPVFAHVLFGDVVHSPVIPKGSADVLLGMERMELLRWRPGPSRTPSPPTSPKTSCRPGWTPTLTASTARSRRGSPGW